MIFVVASFALGIAGVRVGLATLSAVHCFLVCAGMLLLIGLLALRRKWAAAAMLVGLIGYAGAGAAAAILFEHRFPPRHVSHLGTWGVNLEDAVRLEGRLVSNPQRTSYGVQFDVEVRRLESGGRNYRTSGKVRLRVLTPEDAGVWSQAASSVLDLQYGEPVRVLARLRKPRVYRNPGSFDFRRWMESIEDVSWVGTVKSPLLVEKLPGQGGLRLSTVLPRARARLISAVDRLYPPWSQEARYGAFIKAVLLGDRSSLDADTMENFRRTGLYHLLVVSGLHVGLLAMLAELLLRFLRLRESRRVAVLLLLVAGYSGLVELRAPTLRAALMIGMYCLARLLYRNASPLNAVGGAGLVLLLHRPAWLFDSGFQLSFTAALLIAGWVLPLLERTTEPYRRGLRHLEGADLDIALSPRQAQFRLDLRNLIAAVRRRAGFFDRHPAWVSTPFTVTFQLGLWIVNAVLFSAVLQLGLLFPLAEQFHRVSYGGVFLNAAAVPVMTLLLAVAAPVVLLASVFPSVVAWPAKPLSLVTSVLLALADLPRMPGSLSYRVPEPPVWVGVGCLLAVLLAALALGRWKRLFWLALAGIAVFGVLISLYPFRPKLPGGVVEVTALDCGGGDSLFVVLPNRSTMLIDGCGGRGQSAGEGTYRGSRWDPGENIISPYLWSRGIKKIDVLVLTHAHEDHLGGLHAVVRNFRIGELWHGPTPSTPSYQALLAQMRQRGIKEREMVAGQKVQQGEAEVEVLWPPTLRPLPPLPSNDDSLVLRIVYGAKAALFPGDITEATERELLAAGVRLESDLLKVAHHGAKGSSSSAFLSRVRPRVAIVQSQGESAAAAIHPRTLQRLRATGAQVLQTGVDGAVQVQMDRSGLCVRSYSRPLTPW